METGQVDPRFRHQGCQPSNEIQWLEDDVRRAVTVAELDPLIAALEALKQAPQDEALLSRVETSFNGLGILQGAVLTYAPYTIVLLSDEPFDKD